MFPAISVVLTVILLNIQVFWDVTLCHWYSSRTACQTTQASYTRRLETSLFPHLKLFWFSWWKVLFLQYGNILIFKATNNGRHKRRDIETKTSPTLPLISLAQRIYITWSLVYKWLLWNSLSLFLNILSAILSMAQPSDNSKCYTSQEEIFIRFVTIFQPPKTWMTVFWN